MTFWVAFLFHASAVRRNDTSFAPTAEARSRPTLLAAAVLAVVLVLALVLVPVVLVLALALAPVLCAARPQSSRRNCRSRWVSRFCCLLQKFQ